MIAIVSVSVEDIPMTDWEKSMEKFPEDILFVKPGGNAEPFVGDEESLSVGWFDLDDLPTPLAASTSERLELFHTYIENKKHGDAHALFQFDGQQY